MRRKNSQENVSNSNYNPFEYNRNNLKNVESNNLTPAQSNKLSRCNSRHSANLNHDYDLNRNRSNPNAITDKDFETNERNVISRKSSIRTQIDINNDFKIGNNTNININTPTKA